MRIEENDSENAAANPKVDGQDSAGGEAYNFSNEIQMTVKDLVSIICELYGGDIKTPVVLNEAPNEIPHQYLSAEKARTELGWGPRYTLKEGLVETIAWYRDYLTARA